MANVISEISNGLVMGGHTGLFVYLFINFNLPLLTKQIPKSKSETGTWFLARLTREQLASTYMIACVGKVHGFTFSHE